MTKGQCIEYELVTRAVNATDSEGASIILSNFVQELIERWPDAAVVHADGLDAIKRLYLQSFLSLSKWDHPNMRFRDYGGDSDDNLFFYGGDFRIKRTAFSREYLERYEDHAEPPKRPIGFTS
jgi:hypothetical protein